MSSDGLPLYKPLRAIKMSRLSGPPRGLGEESLASAARDGGQPAATADCSACRYASGKCITLTPEHHSSLWTICCVSESTFCGLAVDDAVKSFIVVLYYGARASDAYYSEGAAACRRDFVRAGVRECVQSALHTEA